METNAGQKVSRVTNLRYYSEKGEKIVFCVSLPFLFQMSKQFFIKTLRGQSLGQGRKKKPTLLRTGRTHQNMGLLTKLAIVGNEDQPIPDPPSPFKRIRERVSFLDIPSPSDN